MPNAWKIQWKALLMLVAFTANFTVFCHCAANAAAHACCCEKKAPSKSPKSSPEGCNGMQAVKFNLLEKQVAAHIDLAPTPVFALPLPPLRLVTAPLPTRATTCWPKHPPPDILVLQQRFLI
jgi:hypothetical protein